MTAKTHPKMSKRHEYGIGMDFALLRLKIVFNRKKIIS